MENCAIVTDPNLMEYDFINLHKLDFAYEIILRSKFFKAIRKDILEIIIQTAPVALYKNNTLTAKTRATNVQVKENNESVLIEELALQSAEDFNKELLLIKEKELGNVVSLYAINVVCRAEPDESGEYMMTTDMKTLLPVMSDHKLIKLYGTRIRYAIGKI